MADENFSDPVMIVKLKKGLADRHRVPLVDVLSVLEQVRLMIADVGRRLQKERGVANATGDFGLEVIATDSLSIFRKGSVEMPIAITVNSDTAVLAIQEVLKAFSALEAENGVPEPDASIDRNLLRRMARVATVQRRDHMELELLVHRPGYDVSFGATFGRAGMDTLRAMQKSTFQVEGLTVYGKLVQLVDHDLSDETETGFWGELTRSDGETWRVQFRPDEIDSVAPMFRQQVQIRGKAIYYRVASPKIVVETISLDAERDYEKAFDDLFGSYKAALKSDLPALLREMRED